MRHNNYNFEPLAVVGVSCLFPKSETVDKYWNNIKKKVDAITEVPQTHWKADDYYDTDKKRPDHVYAKTGGFLDAVEFVPSEWGISPADLDSIDTSQLLSLIVARGALSDAGYGLEKEFNRDRVSVILGLTGTLELVIPLGARLGHPVWRRAMLHAGIPENIANEVIDTLGKAHVGWQENSFPGLLGNVAAGRIANRLNLGGTNCVIDAACGSSLGALDMACMELWTKKTDMVITGGVDTFNDIFMYTCFCKTPALSPTGHARPFNEDNDGTILGEGIGMVVIKRLADAERDGDRIYACINAVGSSSDGKGKAIYAPSPDGQVKALARAYEESGISPKDVTYVEAHGTGTGAGDLVEIEALNRVYGPSEKGRPWCALGSVKAQIGHTKAAAGSASLIKAVMALYHKVIPPMAKIVKPAKALLEENIAFYLPSSIRPWITPKGNPRHAAVSSMGFGGSNFHVILTEHESLKKQDDWEGGVEVFTISAPTNTDIKNKLNELKNLNGEAYGRAAANSRHSFDTKASCRLAFVAEDTEDLNKQVEALLTQLEDNKDFTLPSGAIYSTNNQLDKVGVLFPGQGSQYNGMLLELACAFPEAFNTLAEFDKIVGDLDEQGNQLTDLIYPRATYDAEKDKGNEDRLRATNVAQPAIGAISLGMYRLLEALGLKAESFAGHSYGELVALSAAGAFDGETLAKLSHKRGELMASGSGDKGGMIAILGERKAIEEILAKEGLDLVVANHNSNKQVVLSGKTSEIERAPAIFKNHKLRATVLNVAGAFHSSFVADAAKPFSEFLEAQPFAQPQKTVYANTTAEAYPSDVSQAKALLGNQLANQVRFVEIIEKMYADGIRTFVEIGPGKVLSGMLKNILTATDYRVLTLDLSGGKKSSMLDLGKLLAQLAVLGNELDLKRWQNGENWLMEHPTDNKKKMSFSICGANYKSPKQLEILKKLEEPVTPKQWQQEPAQAVTPKTTAQAAQTAIPVATAVAPVASIMAHSAQNSSGQGSSNSYSISTGTQREVKPIMSNNNLNETINALQQMQKETALLHKKFLEGQELAQKTLLMMLGTEPASVHNSFAPQTQPVIETRAYTPAQPAIQVSAPIMPVTPVVAPASVAPVVPTASAQPMVHTATPTVQPIKAAPADNTAKFKDVLIAIVAEKTGYMPEMLNLHMDMESDLGIDSIKRVEIMSAMQERLPEAPVVQPDQLGRLKTLAQILEHLGASNAPSATVVAAAPVAPVAPATSAPTHNYKAVLLEIVAEKTGYMPEMLNLEMDMESDLGIDSIKRVEIMSAMQERLPHAPVVQPDQLGQLKTLGQILEHLGANSASSAVASADCCAPQAVASQGNYKEVLLEIVAEKTGYMPEMLNLDMDMESDLGIDSIKRVEIMSAMQERLPNAPVVQPDQLGRLKTLRQILEYLEGNTAQTVSVVAPCAAPCAPAQDPVVANSNIAGAQDYNGVLMDIIAEKTGYPTNMLSLDMDMEADLGIDSIKRVEILSAFQEKMPNAPVVQPADLGKFKTIGQIIDFLHSSSEPVAAVGSVAKENVDSCKSNCEASQEHRIVRTTIKAVQLEEKVLGEKLFDSNDLILINEDDVELALTLKEEYEAKGYKAITKPTAAIINGDFPSEIKGLIFIAPKPEKAALNLWSETSEEWLKDAFLAIQRAGINIKANKGVIFTVSRMDGSFGLNSMTKTVDPVQGGLAGIAKTIGYEWHEVTARAIDVDYRFRLADGLGAKLANETLHSGAKETGLSQEKRIKIQEIEAELIEDSATPLTFTSKDVILATGGARGVTAATALAFSKKYKTTMVLMGRSPLPSEEASWSRALTDEAAIKRAIFENTGKQLKPKELEAEYKALMANREVLQNLEQMRQNGSKVYYYSVNIRDEQATQEVIDRVRQELGDISGLIHGAGVLRDRKIEDKTREQLDDVLNTKVSGLRNVLKALLQDNLKAMVLFSSFSGRQGRAGQVDYSMANEVLNKAAQKLRILRPECRVMSFNWGPWDGGMVNASLRTVFLAEGIGLIPLEKGANCPIVELSNPSELAVEIGIMGAVGVKEDSPQDKGFSKAFDYELNPAKDGWLNSHVLNGDPVLPMAMAGELMAMGGLQNNLGMSFLGYDEMHILKGVVLKNGAPQTLSVYTGSAQQTKNGYMVKAEIRSNRGGNEVINARANILLSDKFNPREKSYTKVNANLVYPDSINEVYSNDLFHGEYFKSLTEINGWSNAGIIATSKASGESAAWLSNAPQPKLATDPIAIDAAYQLMILWTTKVCGAPSLPNYAASYRKYVEQYTGSTLTISIKAQKKTTMTAIADIDFIGEKGELLASIEGYECTLNENLKHAFKLRNVIGA
jgi:acyl transferase domain-containing protein/NAD(P)-dependent dehydrogenase (short-subunit alcohol dehydrogenase family)